MAVVIVRSRYRSIRDEMRELRHVKATAFGEIERSNDGGTHLLAWSVHARSEVLEVVERGEEAIERMSHDENTAEVLEFSAPRARQ